MLILPPRKPSTCRGHAATCLGIGVIIPTAKEGVKESCRSQRTQRTQRDTKDIWPNRPLVLRVLFVLGVLFWLQLHSHPVKRHASHARLRVSPLAAEGFSQ